MRISDIGRHKQVVLNPCTHIDRVRMRKEVANTMPITMAVQNTEIERKVSSKKKVTTCIHVPTAILSVGLVNVFPVEIFDWSRT